MSVLAHPFYISIFVNVLVTLIVDYQRGQLEFSIASNFWTHLCNFPFWVTLIVFCSCYLLRQFFALWFVQLFFSYLRLPVRKKPQYDNLHALAQVYQPPQYIRRSPKTPFVEAAETTSSTTTPVTPRPRYGFQDV
jgi:hypothetical protein